MLSDDRRLGEGPDTVRPPLRLTGKDPVQNGRGAPGERGEGGGGGREYNWLNFPKNNGLHSEKFGCTLEATGLEKARETP